MHPKVIPQILPTGQTESSSARTVKEEMDKISISKARDIVFLFHAIISKKN